MIGLIMTIALVGVVVWAVLFLAGPHIPEPFRKAIIVVAVVGLAFYLAQYIGGPSFELFPRHWRR